MYFIYMRTSEQASDREWVCVCAFCVVFLKSNLQNFANDIKQKYLHMESTRSFAYVAVIHIGILYTVTLFVSYSGQTEQNNQTKHSM